MSHTFSQCTSEQVTEFLNTLEIPMRLLIENTPGFDQHQMIGSTILRARALGIAGTIEVCYAKTDEVDYTGKTAQQKLEHFLPGVDAKQAPSNITQYRDYGPLTFTDMSAPPQERACAGIHISVSAHEHSHSPASFFSFEVSPDTNKPEYALAWYSSSQSPTQMLNVITGLEPYHFSMSDLAVPANPHPLYRALLEGQQAGNYYLQVCDGLSAVPKIAKQQLKAIYQSLLTIMAENKSDKPIVCVLPQQLPAEVLSALDLKISSANLVPFIETDCNRTQHEILEGKQRIAKLNFFRLPGYFNYAELFDLIKQARLPSITAAHQSFDCAKFNIAHILLAKHHNYTHPQHAKRAETLGNFFGQAPHGQFAQQRKQEAVPFLDIAMHTIAQHCASVILLRLASMCSAPGLYHRVNTTGECVYTQPPRESLSSIKFQGP